MPKTPADNRKQISPERQALVSAIATLATARAELTAAQSVAEASHKALSEVREKVAQFSDIDAEIPHQRLQVLKGADTTRLEELKGMARERVLAREEEEAAQSVFVLAHNEFDTAREKLADAEGQVATAAAQVLGEQFSIVIAELQAIDQRRESIRTILMAAGLPLLNAGWARLTADQRRGIVSSAVSAAGLPAAPVEQWEKIHGEIAVALLATESASPRKLDGDVAAKLAGEWQSFATSLLTDPSAEAGPSISPQAS
jgi:hypothetical protein